MLREPSAVVLEHYMARFAGLHTHINRRRWSAATAYQAPHKPLLLLAVLDLFSQDLVTRNLIEPNADLHTLFQSYCGLVLPEEAGSRLVDPFWDLRHEGFWQLVPLPGKERALAQLSSLASPVKLDELILGASLDEELFALCRGGAARERLRAVLTETFFAPTYWAALYEQSGLHVETLRYSAALVQSAQAGRSVAETGTLAASSSVRTEGFRRTVLSAYGHRCAFCGLRVIAPQGRGVVDAVHIIPWGVARNDDPRNGLALCRLCQWLFEEGLLGVSDSYHLLAALDLWANANLPAHLAGLVEQSVLLPADHSLWPDKAALQWHRQHRMV